jgi:hypothetical protein
VIPQCKIGDPVTRHCCPNRARYVFRATREDGRSVLVFMCLDHAWQVMRRGLVDRIEEYLKEVGHDRDG